MDTTSTLQPGSKVVVTGGAGFVGSHLVEDLLRRGIEVVVVDDLSTGFIGNLGATRPGLEVIVGCASDPDLMARASAAATAVFHLAAAVGVGLIAEDPIGAMETNLSTTMNVCRIAADVGATVLLASSSEVYGRSMQAPFCESDDLVLGASSCRRWSYAATKIVDEHLVLAWTQRSSTPATVVRLFNAIGPRQSGRWGMVVPRFIRQALEGQPITVYGDGFQRRSFTWVNDITRAMIDLVDGGHEGIFNVGHHEDISIGQLAETVRRLTSSHSPIRHIPFHQVYGDDFVDIVSRTPSLTRVNEALGYRPTRSLEEMLTLIIAEQRRSLNRGIAASG